MAKQSEPQPPTARASQLTVAVDKALRQALATAAQHSCRSLSGEIVWRLRCSLEAERQIGNAA
jgi:hypothetical protein